MRGTRAASGAVMALVLTLVLLVAIAFGNRTATVDTRPARADTPAVDPPGASSATWYCAAGTSEPDGYAAATVHVTNLGDDDLDATVRVLPGRDEEPAEVAVVVEPHRTRAVPVADVLATPEPGVVVETFGGSSFVEHELRSENDVAFTPCAATTGTAWYFGSGSTAQGAQQHLVLFNPFSEDASVDISFVTETGFAQPERLQGFTVPRTSRVSIPVHDEISRSELVATRVSVRIGRVVAEQVRILDGSDTVGDREGLAVSLGASSLAEEWVFPWAGMLGGTDDGIAVANFGTESGELSISIALDGDATLEDQTVPIPPRTVTYVDLAARVPAELGSSATLRTSRDVAVVAEQLVSGGGRLATMVGRIAASTIWAFSETAQAFAIFNPGDEAVEVAVRSASGEDLAMVEVAGDDRVEISRDGLEHGGPVVIEATGPVFVVRVGSLTVSPGVVGR